MPAIVRPERQVVFSDRPRGPIAADLLDAQIHNLIEAIHSTQQALADIRRDDGRLRSNLIGPAQITPDLVKVLVAGIEKYTAQAAGRAEQGAAKAEAAVNDVALFAADAEHAAITAASFLTAVNTATDIVVRNAQQATAQMTAAESEATSAENWATYSQAQADNAIAAKNEATQWAEYLAGPVVNHEDAPAYIAGHPFGHGLYYQPVEGYGGVAGLWSAKWWAVYAAQLVGPWSIYYLGGWDTPPAPGAIHPDTGIKIANPLPPGSFYYNTSTNTIYFWNGSEWVSPFALASGVTSRFVYVATAGQTAFTGLDVNGATPAVGTSPSDVHFNGVKLVPTSDYTISGNTLTLLTPAPAGSVVQWDLLVPPENLVPGAVQSFKVTLTPAPNGAITQFQMTYNHPVNGPTPVDATTGAQMQVSLDGIVQEPGIDYTALANTLSMIVPPPANSRFWAVWFANEILVTS
jgi:hypothetical protein